MNTFPTPHDSLFRKFFSDASVVEDFLQIHLPSALREMCDLGTLAITSGSFVEDDMRAQYSDMLYMLQTSEGVGYVYCLIEHQSSADEMMAFRLLRYSIAAMHRHLEQGHKKLPLVIPLLFYHGRQSPYPHSLRWLDCFHNPALAQTLYVEAFPLVDVTVIPDDEIKTHRKVALLEYVQKHIRARDINTRYVDIVFLIKLAQPSKDQVKSLLNYLAKEADPLDLKAFIRILIENTPRYREEMMTVAEQLKQIGREIGLQQGLRLGHNEGRIEGRTEGRIEGRNEQARKIALNMLALGMDRVTIERVTGFSRQDLADLADFDLPAGH
ncbi:Rpn family recombination-promoting nuclease/putative transposase [Sodalis ligni]|uniref:Putative transposase/invertase (TIGR01784 family) n=1 Tax=Sodalis ligni TaxID=2697027 RepID=A0A4R1N749_9GAMM|nr:putative transposase/invertase (TIGR01784 family) [Sodalis ligni]